MSERKAERKSPRRVTKGEVVAAFTEDHVSALTGITKRQLQYWDRDGFFTPSLAYEDRSFPYARLYSFRDVVCLKVLNELRNNSKCSLPHLKDVKERLLHLGPDMWAKTTLYVLNKRVVLKNPKTKGLEEVVSGQGVLQIPLQVVADDMKAKVEALRIRKPASVGQFEQRRNRMHNQLVIAGTRIPVRSVKAFHEAGYSIDRIKKEYPTLTDEDMPLRRKPGACGSI